MSRERALQILTNVAVRFRMRNVAATGPLPSSTGLGRSARGYRPIDALLQWAIEEADRALQCFQGDMEGFRRWNVWGFRHDLNPEQVDMTIWLQHANHIEDEIVVIARRTPPTVSVDVSFVTPGTRRQVLLAHADGLETTSFSGAVINTTLTPTAPSPRPNVPRTPASGASGTLSPSFIFREYPSPAGAARPARR
jgi:hypothetical protein